MPFARFDHIAYSRIKHVKIIARDYETGKIKYLQKIHRQRHDNGPVAGVIEFGIVSQRDSAHFKGIVSVQEKYSERNDQS